MRIGGLHPTLCCRNCACRIFFNECFNKCCNLCKQCWFAIWRFKNPVIKSSGRVTNNLDNEDAKYDVYTITNSHLKTTNIEFQTDGYNFVGWFNGDYDAYVKALADATAETPVEYFSTENMLSVKTADYQNLTAVFEVKTFTVSYNYDSDPDNDGSGEGTTTVPEGGSASYDYGAPLPVLADTYKNHFLGWSVNGGEEIYTSAMFNGIEGEIVLNAVWQEYPEFSYSISYDYSNWNADLEEGEDPVETSVVAITTKLDEIQLPSLDAYQKKARLHIGEMKMVMKLQQLQQKC